MDEVMIAAMPADTADNRQRMEQMGVLQTWLSMTGSWPPPYQGSIEGKCEACGGQVWIGPEQQKVMEQTHHSTGLKVYCLPCAVVIHSIMQEPTTVQKLSEKKWGE